MEKRAKDPIPNIWTAQESLIHFYRILSSVLGLFAIIMVAILIVISFEDPIVVVRSDKKKEYYLSVHQRVPIEKSDIESLVEEFLHALYVWPRFDVSNLKREISPYAEEGLVNKILEAHSRNFAKELSDKKLAQAITFVGVEVLEDRVVARLDRILKVEGVPLVIPTEVTLFVIQGAPTRFNPKGIFISSLSEVEGAK